MTKEDFIQAARELRRQGYNCAQSVLIPLAENIGLDADTAARISSGLGAGVGACGEICGAANAMAMAESMLHSSAPESKKEAMAKVKSLVTKFSEENGNRVRCHDLKGKAGVRPCDELVFQALEIFLDAHPEFCN